jgi:hypothetical protein
LARSKARNPVNAAAPQPNKISIMGAEKLGDEFLKLR